MPAGVKFRTIRGQSVVVAQEVAPEGISRTPVLVATQTLLLPGSTAIVPKEVTLEAEKVDEGGELPPAPPPPIPQEERERRKKNPKRMRPPGNNPLNPPRLFFIRFPPDLSPAP
jgi:hypothetical protein